MLESAPIGAGSIEGGESQGQATAAPTQPLILASASQTRRALLRAVGLQARAVPAAIDEGAVKASMAASGAGGAATAHALAVLKAQRISASEPNAFVIGADQLLVCEGVWYDKPTDRTRAREQLLALRGRTHVLETAVTVVREGAEIWSHVASPRLTMRAFTEAFLDAHLDASGKGVCATVGGYRLEDHGAQLFERVEGDWFAIMGLPLLPLLAFLRAHGVVGS